MLISLMDVSGKPSVSRSILIFFSAKIFLLSLSRALHIPPAGQAMLILAQHSISRCHTDYEIFAQHSISRRHTACEILAQHSISRCHTDYEILAQHSISRCHNDCEILAQHSISRCDTDYEILAQHSISRCDTDCEVSDNLLIAGNGGVISHCGDKSLQSLTTG